MYRLFKHILPALCLTAAACSTDPGLRHDPATEEETSVKLHIHTPGAANPATRADGTDYGDENRVVNLCVLVLRQSGSDYLYQYMAEASTMEQTSINTATFGAVLKTSTDPIKLIVLANYPDLSDMLPTAGSSEADLRAALKVDFDGTLPEVFTGAASSIPMYGETTMTSLAAGSGTTVSLPLMRSMAKVNITTGLKDGSKGFTVTSVAIYRANSAVQLIPTIDNVTGGVSPKATAASIPNGAVALPDDVSLAATVAGAAPSIYLSESLPSGDTASEQTAATCVVVGGLYDTDTDPTYYRVDFNSGIDGHPFGQVLRNYSYTFNIEMVMAQGEALPATAANQVAASMIATITAWSEPTTNIFFPDTNDYITLTDSEATLPYYAGGTYTITMTSTVDFTAQLDGNSTTLSGTDGGTQSNDFCTVTLTETSSTPTSTGGTATTYELTFSALARNTSSPNTNTGGTLTITAGIGQLTLPVEQESGTAYASRKINVLSLDDNGYGSLGDSFGTTYGTRALRPLLDNPNNFGPTGTVQIGGFNYELFTYPNDSNAAKLAYTLGHIDILLIPYNADPSQSCCNAIWNWLQNPNKVLFLSRDYSGTNDLMSTTIDANLTYSMTWTAYGGGSGTGSLLQYMTDQLALIGLQPGAPNYVYGAVALQTNDNLPFTAGVFGTVPNVAGTNSFTTCDSGSMYVMSVPDGITPIVNLTPYTSNGGGTYVRTPAMMMGVDIPRRIVYMGDSQMNTTTCMDSSGNAVVAGNALNQIQANTWAWAVDQVLMSQ